MTNVMLEITDDGRGEPGSKGDRELDGHGLAGLIERAHALGGTVEASADPDGGFRLRVSVPARSDQAAA